MFCKTCFFPAIICFWILLCGFNPFLKENADIKSGNETYAEGKFDQSQSNYDNAVKSTGNSFESHFNRGDALFKQGKMEESLDEFMKASGSTDKEIKSKSLYNAANAQAKLGKQKEAVESLVQSLMLDPENMNAKYNLELLLREQQKQEQQQKPQPNEDQEKKKEQDALDRMREKEKPMPQQKQDAKQFGRKDVEKDW